jgi:hypothetical protein
VKRISILMVALLALVVAACAGQQAASPSAAEPEPVVTAEPTPEPASEAPDPTDDNGPSGDGTALADLIPDELNGVPRTDIPGMDAMIASALAAQGMDASGAEFVLATYGEGANTVTINAFRVPDLDQPSLEMLARAMSGVQSDGSVAAETVTVGGKTVLRMTGTGADGAAYLYFTNDAVFTVVGPSEDLAEQLLAELP